MSELDKKHHALQLKRMLDSLVASGQISFRQRNFIYESAASLAYSEVDRFVDRIEQNAHTKENRGHPLEGDYYSSMYEVYGEIPDVWNGPLSFQNILDFMEDTEDINIHEWKKDKPQ